MKSTLFPLTLALAALGLLPRDTFAHSAVEPASRNSEQWWKDRQELLNQRATEAGEKAQIIFIGDSITQGWESEGKEVWAKYYAPRNAVNLGIGGDRTQHVLWRLGNGNLNGVKPKAVVLMIGTNNSNGEDNSVTQIADGVAAIVKMLRDRIPDTKILLVSIFPRGENPNPQRGKVLQVNQILQKLADEKNVFWIDFGYKFVTPEGVIPRDLMPDFLHLTPKAYGIWADSIEDRISLILGDKRVMADAAGAGSLTGEWVWTMETPNGPVSAPLILKTDGDKVTGRFARSPDKWLVIENGQVNGNEFTWTVKRDRPDGSIMTYRMSGKVAGDKIDGKAKTEIDGTETQTDWSAKRK